LFAAHYGCPLIRGKRRIYSRQRENIRNRVIIWTQSQILLWAIICLIFYSGRPVDAQGFHVEPGSLAPISLPTAPLTPSLTPTDVTPVNIGRERELLKPGYTYYLFQKLPAHLWFNISAETSQRFESNVFFTKSDPKRDYVYRILPNISLGYETFKKINIYCNYFVIKDLFAGRSLLSFPTTQSLAMGIRRDFMLTPRTNFQVDFQARELWQSTNLRQFDFLPGITLTRFVTPSIVVYANAILQLRGGKYFVAPTREIDPFYTIGCLYTKGSWMFSTVGTLVNNFRHPPFNDAIPPVSNNSIILDFEISHPVPKLPALAMFVRAEPIFNWHSHDFPGISGFDFRLFSGIRMTIAKPAYRSSMQTLKQQLKELNLGPAGGPSKTPNVNTNEGPFEGPGTGPSEIPGTGPVKEPNQEPKGPPAPPPEGPVEGPASGPSEIPGTGPSEIPGTGPVKEPNQEPKGPPAPPPEAPGGGPNESSYQFPSGDPPVRASIEDTDIKSAESSGTPQFEGPNKVSTVSWTYIQSAESPATTQFEGPNKVSTIGWADIQSTESPATTQFEGPNKVYPASWIYIQSAP